MNMLRPCLLLSALVACGLAPALADTVQLKDRAAITGKVLAEKSDHIAVDIGFTVLVIPRSQIVTIVRNGNPAPASKSPRDPKPAATSATFTPSGAVSTLMPKSCGAGAACARGKPKTAVARPDVSLAQSASASQGRSEAMCLMPRFSIWCCTPSPWSM